MITIAVVNSKGGVGKTTLAAAMAVRGAQENRRVCMVDLDPQRSLCEWWKRRGKTDNPTIFEGVSDPLDARERAELAGYDWCFLDGPPAFLTTLQDMVNAADFALIPIRPSLADMLATEDTVVITRDAEKPFLVVFNDVSDRDTRIVTNARGALFSFGVPIAETTIWHRGSHITGMNAGKSAAEVNNGRDAKAVNEIDALWQELKTAALRAVQPHTTSMPGSLAQ